MLPAQPAARPRRSLLRRPATPRPPGYPIASADPHPAAVIPAGMTNPLRWHPRWSTKRERACYFSADHGTGLWPRARVWNATVRTPTPATRITKPEPPPQPAAHDRRSYPASGRRSPSWRCVCGTGRRGRRSPMCTEVHPYTPCRTVRSRGRCTSSHAPSTLLVI
jgi:hypothetical protein